MKQRRSLYKDSQDLSSDSQDGRAAQATFEARTNFVLQRDEGHNHKREGQSSISATPARGSNRTGLPDTLKSKMESTFGRKLDHVRVHTNSSLPKKVGAIATTQGNRMDFAPGYYNPTSTQGQKLIGHETWHTVQQAEGRVKPTLQMKTGHLINDSAKLEKEADVMGARVVQSGAAQSQTPITAPSSSSHHTPIQRTITMKDTQKVLTTRAEVIALAEVFTPDKFTLQYRGLVKWYLNHAFDTDRQFKSQKALFDEVTDMLEEMEAELLAIGVQQNEIPAFYDMYNKLDSTVAGDEVVLHKLHYPNMKKYWVEEHGGGTAETHQKGTVYNPQVVNPRTRRKELTHTMPLNYSWAMAVAHHGLPICITVPLTERVLIRPKTNKGRTITDMAAVRALRVNAPISATAREVLAFLRTGYYRVSLYDMDEGEIILVPTGRGRSAWPRDVVMPRTMRWDHLQVELRRYGIYVVDEQVAIDKEQHLTAMYRARRPAASAMSFDFRGSAAAAPVETKSKSKAAGKAASAGGKRQADFMARMQAREEARKKKAAAQRAAAAAKKKSDGKGKGKGSGGSRKKPGSGGSSSFSA